MYTQLFLCMPNLFRMYTQFYSQCYAQYLTLYTQCRRCNLYRFKKNKGGVYLDGRDVRVLGKYALMWEVGSHTRAPHDIVATIKGMTYMTSGGNGIVIFEVHTHEIETFV